jgi:glycosyltransferase involved in cell wall biosynthesis
MKILFLTPYDPTVKDGGGYLRSTLLWRALQGIGEVDTVVVNPYAKPYRKGKDRVWCSNVRSVFRYDWRICVFQFLSAFTGRMDWAFVKREEILKRLGCNEYNYDCVVVNLEIVAWRTAAWKIAPLYLDFDELPSDAFRIKRMPMMTKINGLIHFFLEKWWERFIALQCAGAWMSNPDTLSHLPSSIRKQSLRNIGNAPSPKYRISGSQGKAIVTVGTYRYQPNRDGIDWFLKEIWPQTHRSFPELELWIVGTIPEEFVEAAKLWASNSNVRVLGFVDDIEKVYEKALCTLASVKSGVGTSVKVIESALFGRTALATSIAGRGLSAEDREHLGINVFDGSNDFLECIAKLMSERGKDRDERQNAILTYANARFSFEGFKKSVSDMLKC